MLCSDLANCCIVSGNLLWSLVTRNIGKQLYKSFRLSQLKLLFRVAGQTKKTTVFTLMFVAFALGNIIGPQVFRSKDMPRYHHAFASHIALYGALFIPVAVV